MKRKPLGCYDYTVILTYCGMLFAFCGVFKSIGQEYWKALFCLMLAGICDMFDGIIASTKVRTATEKRFGIQIDSLSDLISFGVLPGIFVYVISGKSIFAGIICSLFVLCALIRLAYFNVLEEERQNQTTERRKSYLGLPVTTVAIFLPLIFIMYNSKVWKSTACFQTLLFIMGIFFLTPVEIKKPGLVGKIFLIVFGIMEFAGMIFFMRWDLA